LESKFTSGRSRSLATELKMSVLDDFGVLIPVAKRLRGNFRPVRCPNKHRRLFPATKCNRLWIYIYEVGYGPTEPPEISVCWRIASHHFKCHLKTKLEGGLALRFRADQLEGCGNQSFVTILTSILQREASFISHIENHQRTMVLSGTAI